jgi:hypothetical protein
MQTPANLIFAHSAFSACSPTASVMLRSVGGDELNVTVAAARLMQPGDLSPQVTANVSQAIKSGSSSVGLVSGSQCCLMDLWATSYTNQATRLVSISSMYVCNQSLLFGLGSLTKCDTKVARVVGADIGTFTVIPELKQVHYQRRQGAFAQQAPHVFKWDDVLLPCVVRQPALSQRSSRS